MSEEEDTPERKDAVERKVAQAQVEMDLEFPGLTALLDAFYVDMHIVFNELVGLVAAFDDYVTYVDIVTWTYTLSGIFKEDNYNDYVDVLAWTYSLP